MNQIKDFFRARERISDTLVRTPFLHSKTLSQLSGVDLLIKYENLQFTASFKERGALNRLLVLDEEQKKRGVIAMSAGNHAQAVARHAERLGIRSVIVMPRTTPVSKIEQTRVYDCEVVLEGTNVSETFEYVDERIARDNLILIHPFDDPLIIAGQGTLGLEMLEQDDSFDTVVVPIGGGGLISGVAQVVKHFKSNARVIGVQAEAFKGTYSRFKNDEFQEPTGPSVAEGIAVKRPSPTTMAIINEFVDDIVTVTEDQIEDAIFKLLEIEKTLAEGAGAAALAAVFHHRELFHDRTAVLVTGGNIDMTMLTTVIQRELVRQQRVVKLHVTIQDIPGALSALTKILSEMDSNIIEISHKRTFGQSTHGSTIVELTLQVRGRDELTKLLAKLNENNYHAKHIVS